MSHLGSSLRAYNVRSRLKVVAIITDVVVDAVVVIVVVRKGLTIMHILLIWRIM